MKGWYFHAFWKHRIVCSGFYRSVSWGNILQCTTVPAARVAGYENDGFDVCSGCAKTRTPSIEFSGFPSFQILFIGVHARGGLGVGWWLWNTIVWYACENGGLEKVNVATSIVIGVTRSLMYTYLSMRSCVCCGLCSMCSKGPYSARLRVSWICDEMR